MQGLTLLLLLGIVASTMFGFAPVFAQEAEESSEDTMTDEEMTDEEMADEEVTDEEVADEEVMDETMDGTMEETMEDTMEEEMLTTAAPVASPLQQLKSGTDPHEIQCGEGMKLVFKASNFRPSCIKESSYDILSQRGWVSAHDPSHEELAGMVESIPKDEVMEETPEETEEEIELEEEVEVEESASSGNGTEPTPQNHTIELSESMEMGAN
jgi:hypothetical protein